MEIFWEVFKSSNLVMLGPMATEELTLIGIRQLLKDCIIIYRGPSSNLNLDPI